MITEDGLFVVLKNTFPQILSTLFGTLIAFSDGISYGWTSPMIPYLTNQSISHIPMTETQANFLETIYLCGAVAGLPFTIIFVDLIGRKFSILFSASLQFGSWLVIWFAPSKDYLYVARFFQGLAGDMCYVAAPMYITEIADTRIRGFLSSYIYIMSLWGVLVEYAVGGYTTYYVAPIIGVALTAIQLSVFIFMPETPYYYVLKNKRSQAEQSIKRLKPYVDLDQELKQIDEAVLKQNQEKGRPQDLILVRSNRIGIVIMTVLNFSQHMSGISVVLMNLQTILDEGDSSYLNSKIAAIIFAILMLISSLASASVVDKFGRKIILITSSICSGIFLLILSIYFHLHHLGKDVTSFSWIPCVCVMIYGIFFKFGLGIVPIVITAEIFPPSIKAMGMTLADVIYVAASIVSIQLYQILYNRYNMSVPFYMFTVCAFLSAVFTKIFVPETKGKSLAEIQMMLKGG